MTDIYEWIRGLAAVFAVLLSTIAMWWSRQDRSSDAARAAITKLQQQSDERFSASGLQHAALATRIAAVDEHLKAIPQRADMDDISGLIRELTHKVGQLEGEQKAAIRTLDRISTFLLERSR